MPKALEAPQATTSERQAVCLAQLQMLRRLEQQRRCVEG